MDILKDRKYYQSIKLNRYSQFPYFYNTLDDKYVNETPKRLDKNTEYSIYEVKGNESYDLISLKKYNNPTYYWVICDFNDILNPFEQPQIGTKLKIPILSNIRFIDI